MKLFYQLIVLILMINLCHCLDLEKALACEKKFYITDGETSAIPRNATIDDISTKLRCYLKCIYEEYFGSDGKVDPKLVNEERLRPKVLLCKEKYDNTEEKTGCDYAAQIIISIFAVTSMKNLSKVVEPNLMYL
ncbi:uncharacterized protein LOC111519049 [Drosophila willistoni]|uniref:uncharacterized protein LOC111519049 n=1 Tax=Drosophila willistoni TaxID=7260 RepID=UPI000C26D0E8|nr:uncharacterized protein LOC111519049 [Drosophila willistoni]